MNLIKQINELRKSDVAKLVDSRLKEFKRLNWFSEMCFCLLTSNSKASTALAIQNELGCSGFSTRSCADLVRCIKRHKHRFHNVKAKYIVEARHCKDIKRILKSEEHPREWLVNNIKGLGWKEASHFLRNVGYTDYAILDRHIINLLFEHGFIDSKPRSLSKKEYLRIEKVFTRLAKRLDMSCAELDFYMWYIKTGKILK